MAIELDPRTTKSAYIKEYAALGFNRVSIGLQDLDSDVQHAIGRIQPYELIESLISNLRSVNISNINLDLIYGLPKQTLDGFEKTIQQVITLNPSRVALFSYAHVPKLKKHQRLIDIDSLPSEKSKLELYMLAAKQLGHEGYISIGMDHFAKTTDTLSLALTSHTLSRNFQGYVADNSDVLIGIGSSAISQFKQGYIQNSVNISDYRTHIKMERLASHRGLILSIDDIIRKRVIDEFMCYLFVDLKKIERDFVLDNAYFDSEVKVLSSKNYQSIVSVIDKVVQLITPFKMASRMIALVFDQHRQLVKESYSKVV